MAVAETAVSRFDMGRTAKRTFAVAGENIVTFGVLSLLVGVPLAVMAWGGTQFPGTLANRISDPGAVGFYAIVGLAYLVGNFVLQAGIVQGTVASLNAKRATLAECLSVGLAAFFPLLLLTLVVVLGFVVGFLLLFVPGIILVMMWSVAVPTLVVEHTTIGGTLARSRQLTRGHRWAIFGMFLAFTILNFIIAFVGGVVVGAGSELANATSTSGASLGAIAVNSIASMIGAVLGAAMIASIYYELRVIKEGIGPEALASVFD